MSGSQTHHRISHLGADFGRVVDIVSDTPVVALALRSLTKERADFLLAIFPVADLGKPAPSPVLIPQIADGSGCTTEFILIGAGSFGKATVSFLGDSGDPLAVGK